MGKQIINGVFFFPIKKIRTTGGEVMHAVKGLDEHLVEFGECYFSTAQSKSPKAWKKHTKMVCNIFVPTGKVKFVFYDDRMESNHYSKVEEFVIGEDNYGRLVINPGVWFGFSAIGAGDSLILNVANIKHDPSESVRLEPDNTAIPYTWKFD